MSEVMGLRDNRDTTSEKPIFQAIETIMAENDNESEDTTKARRELYGHFNLRLDEIYYRSYGVHYVHSKTKVSIRLLETLAEGLVDEYINETRNAMQEAWSNIESPASMKRLIQSVFYPMSILYKEIFAFRSSVLEKTPSTTIQLTFSRGRFTITPTGVEHGAMPKKSEQGGGPRSRRSKWIRGAWEVGGCEVERGDKLQHKKAKFEVEEDTMESCGSNSTML